MRKVSGSVSDVAEIETPFWWLKIRIGRSKSQVQAPHIN